MSNTHNNGPAKISPPLAARLANLIPESVVRVVILLNIPAPATTGRRLTVSERSQAITMAKETTEQLWKELRPTLGATGASRVDVGGTSALGGIVLDIPARHVGTLAAAEQVRAVLDDQQLVLPRA